MGRRGSNAEESVGFAAGPSRRRLVLATLVVVALVALAGCGALADSLASTETEAPPDPNPMAFENATAESGLDYEGGALGAGAGNNSVYAGDFDDNGYTDLLLVGGGSPALYRNTGGEFEEWSAFPEVDAALKSATVVDYDDDGWTDVVLFRKWGHPVALHNDEGRFERAGDLGMGNLSYPMGATAADYDEDGDTDLFVYQSGSWSERNPKGYNSLYKSVEDDNGNPNVLYENTGTANGSADGSAATAPGDATRFRRAADAGVEGERWSLAASFADLTGDGLPDVHVANDFNNDTLYVNQGDGTFEQRMLGEATARNGMSSEVADVNGDGRPDLLVTNIEIPLKENRDEMGAERYDRIERLFSFVIKSGRTNGNTLLINEGNGTFTDRAAEYGVQTGGWGWAADVADFNNDGARDLIHATENVVRINRSDPVWTNPMVWRGVPGNDSFEWVNESAHGMGELDGRGLATLDYDNDGDRDLVFSTGHGHPLVYENTVEEGSAVQFEVVEADGTRALGAEITVEVDGEERARWQTDENDFFSRESPYLHAGLGDADAATLSVTWSDGTEREFEVEAGQRVRVAPNGTTVIAELGNS